MMRAGLRSLRSATWAMVCGAGVFGAFGRAQPADPAEKPVELPPFLVEENKHVRPWVYVATPGHEVLSRCSDEMTTGFAVRELRLEELLATILPPQFQFSSSVPKPTILVPPQLVSSSARDVVLQANPDHSLRPGSHLESRSVHFLPNLALDDLDLQELFAILDEDRDNAATLVYTRARIQFVLRRRTPALPAWFVAGFQWLFDDLQFGPDKIVVAPLQWQSADVSNGLRVNPDYPRTFVAMRDVFAVARGNEGTVPPDIAQQAALFIRWAIQDPGRREGLWALLTATEKEPIGEAVVQRCFGCDLTDLRDKLSDYLPLAVRDSFEVKPPNLAPRPKLSVRGATPAQVGRILGDWERLEIRFVTVRHPEFVPVYAASARKTLDDARRWAPDDPMLGGIVGLLECDTKHDDTARAYLEAAVAANVVRPRIYLELARLRYLSAIEHPAGLNGRLNVPQANAILEPLGISFRQLPPLLDAYLLTARVWLQTQSLVQPKNLSILEDGIARFPSEPRLLFLTAILEAEFGSRDRAVSYLERGERVSPNDQTRHRFAALREAIVKSHGGPIDLSGEAEEP